MQQRVHLGGVGGYLRREVGLQSHQPLIGHVEFVGKRVGLLQEDLARAGVGGIRGEPVPSGEKIVHRRADAVRGIRRVADGVGGGSAIDLFPEARLGALQGALLRLEQRGVRDLVGDVGVEEPIADLLDAEHFHAGALRTEAGVHDRAIAEDDTLPGVRCIVRIREVAARGLDACLVRAEGAGSIDKSAKKIRHNSASFQQPRCPGGGFDFHPASRRVRLADGLRAEA